MPNQATLANARSLPSFYLAPRIHSFSRIDPVLLSIQCSLFLCTQGTYTRTYHFYWKADVPLKHAACWCGSVVKHQPESDHSLIPGQGMCVSCGFGLVWACWRQLIDDSLVSFSTLPPPLPSLKSVRVRFNVFISEKGTLMGCLLHTLSWELSPRPRHVACDLLTHGPMLSQLRHSGW